VQLLYFFCSHTPAAVLIVSGLQDHPKLMIFILFERTSAIYY